MKMNRVYYWFGIFTHDHKTWIDTTNKEIDPNLLLWKNGEPNNKGGNEYFVGLSYPGDTVNDYEASVQLASVCDMT